MTSMITKTLPPVLAMTLLGACSATIIDDTSWLTSNPLTNVAPGTAALSSGFHSVTSGGTTITLPATGFTLNGQTAWSDGTNRAGSYVSPSATAIGGIQGTTVFSGVSGTLGVRPASGTATYAGRYSAHAQTVSNNGILSLDVDYGAGTVTATNTTVAIAGTISGGNVTGTVTFNGATAPMVGGFYGTNEIAGAFSGNDIGGIFYGTK